MQLFTGNEKTYVFLTVFINIAKYEQGRGFQKD